MTAAPAVEGWRFRWLPSWSEIDWLLTWKIWPKAGTTDGSASEAPAAATQVR
jgi:hypothetical protein